MVGGAKGAAGREHNAGEESGKAAAWGEKGVKESKRTGKRKEKRRQECT